MLEITVSTAESYDEAKGEFVSTGEVVLELEHSLVSLSKWESKHEKPFLAQQSLDPEELLSYIHCMTLTPNVAPEVFHKLSEENVEAINAYISAKHTATWFAEEKNAPKPRETITAELIYYWMTAFNIPFECQHWHLNRLITLIRICGIKQEKPKKMSRAEVAQRNRELNAQRKAKLGTSG